MSLKITVDCSNEKVFDLCFKGKSYETHVQLSRNISKKQWARIIRSIETKCEYDNEFEDEETIVLVEIYHSLKDDGAVFCISSQPEDIGGIAIDITIRMDNHHDKNEVLSALKTISSIY